MRGVFGGSDGSDKRKAGVPFNIMVEAVNKRGERVTDFNGVIMISARTASDGDELGIGGDRDGDGLGGHTLLGLEGNTSVTALNGVAMFCKVDEYKIESDDSTATTDAGANGEANGSSDTRSKRASKKGKDKDKGDRSKALPSPPSPKMTGKKASSEMKRNHTGLALTTETESCVLEARSNFYLDGGAVRFRDAGEVPVASPHSADQSGSTLMTIGGRSAVFAVWDPRLVRDLSFMKQPRKAVANRPLKTGFVVVVRNAEGRACSAYTGSVTMSILSFTPVDGAGGQAEQHTRNAIAKGFLVGPLQVKVAKGCAHFRSKEQRFSQPGTYVVKVSSHTGEFSVTSAPIRVEPDSSADGSDDASPASPLPSASSASSTSPPAATPTGEVGGSADVSQIGDERAGDTGAGKKKNDYLRSGTQMAAKHDESYDDYDDEDWA